MNQTQSIIVYRNPMEQAFWEGLMNSSAIMPIMFGIVAFFVSFLILNSLLVRVFRASKIRAWHNGYDRATTAALTLAAVIGFGTVCLTWI